MLTFEEMWSVEQVEPRVRKFREFPGVKYNGRNIRIYPKEGSDGKYLVSAFGLVRAFSKCGSTKAILEECGVIPECVDPGVGRVSQGAAVDAHGAVKILSYIKNRKGAEAFIEFFKQEIFPLLAQ